MDDLRSAWGDAAARMLDDLYGPGSWFTVTPEAVRVTIDGHRMRLRNIAHIDYYYVGDCLRGASLVLKESVEGHALVEVGPAEAQGLQGIIEEFVMPAYWPREDRM